MLHSSYVLVSSRRRASTYGVSYIAQINEYYMIFGKRARNSDRRYWPMMMPNCMGSVHWCQFVYFWGGPRPPPNAEFGPRNGALGPRNH